MNKGQEMFYEFFMKMVKEGKEEEAKRVLLENFEKQNNGTFTFEYLNSVKPIYFSLIKPEFTEQLEKAMSHFASNL